MGEGKCRGGVEVIRRRGEGINNEVMVKGTIHLKIIINRRTRGGDGAEVGQQEKGVNQSVAMTMMMNKKRSLHTIALDSDN